MGRGESQNLDDLDLASAWLTRSELVSLREALDSFVPAPDAQTLKRKRHDDESQPARSQQPVWPAEPSAASPVTSQDINEIIGGKAGWAGEKIGKCVPEHHAILRLLLNLTTACLWRLQRFAA